MAHVFKILVAWSLLGQMNPSALIPAHRADGASRCAPSAWLLGRNPDTCPVAGRNPDTPSVAGRHLDVFEPSSVRKPPEKHADGGNPPENGVSV